MNLLKRAVIAAAFCCAAASAAQAEALFAGQKLDMYPGYVIEDLPKARGFFVDALGFAPIFENDWFVLLQLDDVQLALMKQDQPQVAAQFRQTYPGNGSWLALNVPDVDAVYARAKAAGLDIFGDIRDEPWGERHFSVMAPGGLALDIITFKGPAPAQ